MPCHLVTHKHANYQGSRGAFINHNTQLQTEEDQPSNLFGVKAIIGFIFIPYSTQ